ncbi:ribonuclease E activity regulator RraA [Sulfurospirillum arcachonense]|uniref:ribonuclease E activity regulator RraA n=1 Tax=Sulfurospirillum arcachonense TaxID=57666 RepID=UPI00046A9BDA|nr:ribonuclease E activity regulator RraA [Sulfurospirillum arcachonense]
MSFSTADLCDKYDDKVQVLNPGFNSYGGIDKFYGKIATCKLIDNNTELIKLLKTKGDKRVCVVDVDAKYIAVVGDKLMAFAKENNWAGIIVNGYVRDIINTQSIDVGLFALGTCPKKAPIINKGEQEITLNFAGVKLVQNEYLYADNDGIITSKEALEI